MRQSGERAPVVFPQTFPAPADFPAAARLLAPAARCDFRDVQKAVLPGSWTALDFWNAAMARPLPGMGLAFRLRDAISARFGVERIGGFSGARRDSVATGERLDFFLVEEAMPERLLLSVRDRHLDVLTCVTASPVAEGTEAAVTSSVVTHNLFGRLYMIPVGPAHRLLVRRMLSRLAG